MKRPNVFLLGAPKCGTTSLMAWFGQHPEAFASFKFSEKEPHHFYSPYGVPCSREAYEALYEQATPQHKAVIEGSVWYLFGRKAVRPILEYSPEAKFIVCLRNPVDMLPSLHAQKMFSLHEGV